MGLQGGNLIIFSRSESSLWAGAVSVGIFSLYKATVNMGLK